MWLTVPVGRHHSPERCRLINCGFGDPSARGEGGERLETSDERILRSLAAFLDDGVPRVADSDGVPLALRNQRAGQSLSIAGQRPRGAQRAESLIHMD